ncbi:hypothetical protein NDU88_003478 [Pleurodeles waltl]|uniref:Uncharacterized protein n=1 Tax=Pleurodeles waltl TaxID=8319 RepID=A0AAV7UC68_PLEWA|nr:hypothetical protein NDU88_003478 [Pleurodeles waltl]
MLPPVEAKSEKQCLLSLGPKACFRRTYPAVRSVCCSTRIAGTPTQIISLPWPDPAINHHSKGSIPSGKTQEQFASRRWSPASSTLLCGRGAAGSGERERPQAQPERRPSTTQPLRTAAVTILKACVGHRGCCAPGGYPPPDRRGQRPLRASNE